MKVFHGNIVYSKNKDEIIELEDAYIVVNDKGIIEGIYERFPKAYANYELIDFKDDVIIPAFSDLHVHAPQYPNRGIAMDKILKDWLNDYTFPLEAKYEDEAFAKEVYEKFVYDLIKHGTMHASIFATIHPSSTSILVDILEKNKILSYVGKVNMDKDSPSYLIEDTLKSIQDTETFIKRHINNKYSKPIITPRFAPTCSFDLLKGLGRLSNKYKVGVQTHIVESLWEKEEAKKCYEGCKCDMQIYKDAGLLNQKPFIAGHFIFPSKEDIDYLKECCGHAVQCPDATTNIIAGIMNTGTLLDNGIGLGIGSDISAGSYLGIYRQVSSVVRLSKIKSFYEKDVRNVSFEEAFYMATKSSGSVFGHVGSIEKGYYFDALVLGGLNDSFKELKPKELVERFCYMGSESNIKMRFMRGKKINIK